MVIRRGVCCAFVLGWLIAPALFAQPGTERVLIRAPKPYTNLINAIQSRGGRVTQQYRYVDGIAAEIPRAALAAINVLVGDDAVAKDLSFQIPKPIDTLQGRTPTRVGNPSALAATRAEALSAAQIVSLATVKPDSYLMNNAVANVSQLHAQHITGQGVIVGVIDTGIRPGFPHISLDGSVIGCEDFVGDGLGCSNSANNGHGTFVAGMISANVTFTFPATSAFRNAVLAECPTCFVDAPTYTQIPMVGTAPQSSIYAFRVLGPDGSGLTSDIITALERVIELRELFDSGNPKGVNIQVVNMSFGGPTLFPGHDLIDQTVDLLMQRGIVPVVAAGNAGPATLTTASPGSALSALTVGAASLAPNERILQRVQLGSAMGALYRPFLGTQTAYFSSRGPNSSGRSDPDVVANGVACYGQGLGTTDAISLASGTSFSSPSIAGVAALLRQAFPHASARAIRNSIILSANPNLITDGSGQFDRGAGYVNAAGARSRLASGQVPDNLANPGFSTPFVALNVLIDTDLRVETAFAHERISGLKPGQRRDLLYQVLPNTSQVVITVNNVTPSLPPSQQNQLFGDDVLVAIHTAKTSAIGEGDYPFFAFTKGGTYVVNNPEFGILRVSVNGDWTNAGSISADVSISFSVQPIFGVTSQANIVQGQTVAVPIVVPAGTRLAEFRVDWQADWSNYPANDLDLILVSPTGTVNFDGATLDIPESVSLVNPTPGVWTALILGSDVNTKRDRYDLRVTLDGRLVH